MKRSKPLTSAASVLVLALGACDDTTSPQVAGGEDFPNTVSGVEVLARLADEVSDSSSDWNALREVPSGIPAAELDTVVALPARPPVAATAYAGRIALETQDVDLSDTASGWAVIRVHKVTTAGTQDDTLVMVWNDRAKDTVKGNEWLYRMSSRKTVFSPLRTEYMAATPVAPDTMVTPLPGKVNRILLRQILTSGGVTIANDLVCDPGADLSYDTDADNSIRRARVVRLRGTDTLESSLWVDGDGDSIVLDKATRKPGIVSFVRTIPNPSGVRLARVEERGRLLVDPSDSTVTKPLRYVREEQWRSGRIVVSRIARPKTDSDLVASDTAFVSKESILGTDSLRNRFDLVMGADLADSTQQRLLGYSSRVRNPDGRTLALAFKSDVPLLPGAPPRNGKVVFDVVLSTGKELHLVGRWTDGALSGHVTGSDGLSGTASWDASGTLKSWKPD